MDLELRAFGRFVERHHAAVTAIAFSTTRDLAASEDIAQDTFVLAWTQRDDLPHRNRVRAWLCGIARNLSACDRKVSDIDAVKLASSDTVDALGLIEAAEAEHQVRSALDDVPPSFREPLVLFYWERRSIERVASALGVSEGAAQKRVHGARALISPELEVRLATTAQARRSMKAAASAVIASVMTDGARVSDAGRIALENARPARRIGPLAAIAMAAAVAGIIVAVL